VHFLLEIILAIVASAIFSDCVPYRNISSEQQSETPPEYARTRMAKRHATLRDNTRFAHAGDGVTLVSAFCSGAPLHSERNSALHF